MSTLAQPIYVYVLTYIINVLYVLAVYEVGADKSNATITGPYLTSLSSFVSGKEKTKFNIY